MMDATCKKVCFNSTTAMLYQVGQIESVDETDPWVQSNFDVPKPEEEEALDPESEPEDPPGDGSEPGPVKKPAGKKKAR